MAKVSTPANRKDLARRTIDEMARHNKKTAVAIWEEMCRCYPNDIGESDRPR